ncbi:hypothetical protein [Staphylococcus saprophyticus]|nr:hypothetical protein [Staphylococcus saprophyticus]
MRNIKKYLENNNINYTSNDVAFTPDVRFMIEQEIYLVQDFKNVYEICTIDREMVKEFKSQKALIEFLKEVA